MWMCVCLHNGNHKRENAFANCPLAPAYLAFARTHLSLLFLLLSYTFFCTTALKITADPAAALVSRQRWPVSSFSAVCLCTLLWLFLSSFLVSFGNRQQLLLYDDVLMLMMPCWLVRSISGPIDTLLIDWPHSPCWMCNVLLLLVLCLFSLSFFPLYLFFLASLAYYYYYFFLLWALFPGD